MLSASQLAERRTMITATDQVALAGESPSRGPLAVYMDKIGHLEEDLSRLVPIRIGNRMESLALELLAEEHELVLRPGTTARHPMIAHIGATPDARVMAGEDPLASQVAVAEAKFVGYRQASKWSGASPPDAVLIQVTQQMLVDRVTLAHIVALIGTEARFYVVELDQDLAGALIEQGDTFWTKHVLARKPPEPDASEASTRALRELYPRVRGDVFRASPEVEEIAREYFTASAIEDQASARRKLAENRLKERIGEHEGIDGDGWRARWTERKGSTSWKDAFAELAAVTKTSIDVEQFRGEHTRAFRCDPK